MWPRGPITGSVPQNIMAVGCRRRLGPVALDQRLRAQQGGGGALLVEPPLAAGHGPGAQHHLVPVRRHLAEQPELAADRLGAQLLGQTDSGALRRAVGMIGPHADPQLAGEP